MKWKRVVSVVLAFCFLMGVFSGLPPLRDGVGEEVDAASVHKAYCWETKNDFVDMVDKHFKAKYGTKFNKKGSSVFKNGNLKIDLKDKIKIPGTKKETYRYWWFITLDKYAMAHNSSVGETHAVVKNPTGKSSASNRWATVSLTAKASPNTKNPSAKGGYPFVKYELGGGKDKFKEDLGHTDSSLHGISMYVIDIKAWMKDTGKDGYSRWKKTVNKKGDVIVDMYFNSITKTHNSGDGENMKFGPLRETREAWRNATVGWPIYNRGMTEYDQHYNVHVRFNFGDIIENRSNVFVEGRTVNGSNKYAKTYMDKKFVWGGGDVETMKEMRGSSWAKVMTAEGAEECQ